jgi:hypothetical protein
MKTIIQKMAAVFSKAKLNRGNDHCGCDNCNCGDSCPGKGCTCGCNCSK